MYLMGDYTWACCKPTNLNNTSGQRHIMNLYDRANFGMIKGFRHKAASLMFARFVGNLRLWHTNSAFHWQEKSDCNVATNY